MGQEIGDFAEVIEQLKEGDRLPVALFYRLSDLRQEELEIFCNVWSDIDDERRRLITRNLADITESNYEVDFGDIFAFCLKDKAAPVRLAALDGLWDSERKELIAQIVELMESDEDVQVRALAAATLGHFVLLAEWQQIPRNSVESAIEALIAQYEDKSADRSIRRAAIESVGAATHHRVASLIEHAYEREDDDMQISAVFAMGRSADTRWLPVILDELSSPYSEMRIEAARAAGGIGSSSAVERLFYLVGDEDLEVQLAAVSALGQIGSEEVRDFLLRILDDYDYEDLHEAAEEALEEMDWLGGTVDLTLFDWENGEDDEELSDRE